MVQQVVEHMVEVEPYTFIETQMRVHLKPEHYIFVIQIVLVEEHLKQCRFLHRIKIKLKWQIDQILV